MKIIQVVLAAILFIGTLTANWMAEDIANVASVELAKPQFHFGRILFEDGTPAFIAPNR